VAAVLLFGSVPACVRVIGLNSYALGLVRLALGAAGMTAVVLARSGQPPRALWTDLRRTWRVLAPIGLIFGLHWLCYFQGIKLANAQLGTLGFCTYGVQLPLLGWALGYGRPKWNAATGVALGLVGSWLCLPANNWRNDDALGLAIGVLSGTLYAVLPILHQRRADLDHELRTWGQFCFALPVFLACAPAAEWSFTLRDWLLIAHLGLVVTLVGHLMWVEATTELPIGVTSVLAYLQLPASLAMNFLFIGERMTPAMLAGAACILAANALALWPRRA
jgi:drug/metabolite transporter (DMT)-like permease